MHKPFSFINAGQKYTAVIAEKHLTVTNHSQSYHIVASPGDYIVLDKDHHIDVLDAAYMKGILDDGTAVRTDKYKAE